MVVVGDPALVRVVSQRLPNRHHVLATAGAIVGGHQEHLDKIGLLEARSEGICKQDIIWLSNIICMHKQASKIRAC